jgi:hypothetical protein
MLGKLLKHEFRATARVMLPLFGVLLALSVPGNFSTRILDAEKTTLLSTLGGLVIAAFFIAMFAVCIMSVVIMVQRFHNNLLTDEGYLMFTLPVSVHSLVWSKIIVSVVWFIGTGIVVLLAMTAVTFRVEYLHDFAAQIQDLFQHLTQLYSLNFAAISAELLFMMLLGGIALCLLFYAAMAVGYSFPRHKRLLSVVFFFAFQFAMQIFATLTVSDFGNRFYNITVTPQNFMAAWHGIAGFAIVSELVYCAVFYVITVLSLKKRLNLE